MDCNKHNLFYGVAFVNICRIEIGFELMRNEMKKILLYKQDFQ